MDDLCGEISMKQLFLFPSYRKPEELKGIDIAISRSRYKKAKETPTNPLFL